MKKLSAFIIALFSFFLFTPLASAISYPFTDSFTAPDNTSLSTYNSSYSQVNGNATPVILSNQVTVAPTSTVGYWTVTFPVSLSTIKLCADATNALDNLGFANASTVGGAYAVLTGSSGSSHANLYLNQGANVYSSTDVFDNSGTHTYCLTYDGSTVSVLRDNVSVVSHAMSSIGTITTISFGAHNYTGYGWTNPVSAIDNLFIDAYSPTVGAITVSPNPVQVNNTISASANFTDPNPSATHTATWDWGDGSTPTSGTVTEPSGSTPGIVGADSHTYTTAGVYTITLTVTNNGGASGTSTFQYVSVYNPTAQGLFTAGQHFSSPAGAYPQNSSLTGTVKFGLSYKYQGTMPVGDKQFTMNFSAANLLFNATSISSLVIANNMATLTGTGTINGDTHTYNFLVTGVNGGGIRIQITDPSNNNNVIYDTQPGDAATATPTTTVTGNVIAHN